MAKVKEATAKLTAYFKGKGLDPNEIKDAFAELDAADVDLEKLAEVTGKNTQWETFWNSTAVPEFQKIQSERDALQAKLAKLEAAGFKFGEEQKQETKQVAGTPAVFDAEALKRELATATSGVLKSALKIGFKHYKKFGSDPDYDAMEKLLGEGKASNIEEAYRQWSKPMREERRTKKLEKEIAQKVKEGIASERSKLGITGTVRKRVDEDLNAPSMVEAAAKKDTPVPTERELRDAFMADLDAASNGVLH